MGDIEIERNPSGDRLEDLGVWSWDIWTKETSMFPWFYDEREVCYFLEGDVMVTPEGGEPVRVGKGDLVTFPEGMSCTWQVLSPVRKHYTFG
ncbi:MAG TPA: cupin domain-containing protein [Candidatus Hydrogenedentes bacterium]|nr:cupin domain-containing protein [Candidatus Hydrogenedentota bacterium]HPG68826.1 cupin domain-containing protein [Candidatus Hydrogenedentota bacterium]